MAQEIKLRDGTILEAPDDADVGEVATGYIRNTYPREQQQQELNYVAQQYAQPSSILNAVSQGQTFGFGDEAAGVLTASAVAPFSGKTWGDVYRDTVMRERANLSAAREQYPKSSFAGEVGGAMMTGLGAAKLGAKAGSAVIQRIPNLARLFGLGAGGGALYGAGASEEGERAEGAATGAALGAVTVPLGIGVGYAGRKIAEKLGKPIGRMMTNTPRTQAVRNIIRSIEADDLTPEEAFRKLDELGPDAVLADIGPNMQALARGASGRLGRARSVASAFLTGRQEGQGNRLFKSIVGDQIDLKDFRRGFLSFMNNRQSNAAPLYKEAFEQPLTVTPKLKAILNRPAMRQAMKKGASYLQNEGGGAGHVRLIDYAKQSLDDEIGSAIRSGNRNQARILTRLKKELLEEVDAQVPAYKQARELFSGEAQLRDAASMGRGMFTSSGNVKSGADIDMVEMALDGMSSSERDAFRLGVVRGLADAIETAPETRNVAQQVIRSPRARQALRLAFDSDESFERFIRSAEAESTFSQTRNTVLSGSRTAEFQSDQRAIDQGASVLQAATYSGSDPISSGIQMLKTLGFGDASDETIEEMAKLLFGRGQGLQVMKREAGRAARQVTPQIAREARVGSGVIAGTEALSQENR